MKYNADAVRRIAPWILLGAAPVAGYFIYKNLTPAQKRKFKKTFSNGSLALASKFISKLIDQYKSHQISEEVLRGTRYEVMAAIPNPNETETTIGDERW